MNYQALNNYMLKVSNKPFEWGVHDCFYFTHGACIALLGHGLTTEPPKYSSSRSGHKAVITWLKDRGYANFIEAADSKYKRLNLNSAPRGSLIARKNIEGFYGGYVLGISVGNSITFVDPIKGINFHDFEFNDLVWELN